MLGNVFTLIALVVLLSGCAARSNGAQDDEWRLRTLEETFLDFQESSLDKKARLTAVERRLDSVDERFEELAESVNAVSAVLEKRLAAFSTQPQRPQTVPQSAPQRALERPAPAPAPDPAPVRKSAAAAPRTIVAPTPRTTAAQAKAPAPAGAKALYDQALKQQLAGNAESARPLFERFLERYPNHTLIANAQYWLGETYYAQKNYAQAVLTFRKVPQNFPKHPKAPDALLKIGYSYANLGDKENAGFYLGALLEDYPSSRSAAKARQRLNNL